MSPPPRSVECDKYACFSLNVYFFAISRVFIWRARKQLSHFFQRRKSENAEQRALALKTFFCQYPEWRPKCSRNFIFRSSSGTAHRCRLLSDFFILCPKRLYVIVSLLYCHCARTVSFLCRCTQMLPPFFFNCAPATGGFSFYAPGSFINPSGTEAD